MAKPRTSRPYRKRKRAQREEETRQRITEAAMELHGSVGPANTTVTEVASLAGVSRMTVYNHFPSEVDLFTACSTHWATQNPFPDPTAWLSVPDPSERLASGLAELYAWYRLKQGMLSNILRDTPLVPALAEVMGGLWGGYIDALVDSLATGWPVGSRDTEPLHASLRVAVDFHTWQVLTADGIGDAEAADLAADMVIGAFRLGG
jgi:AcrR family transcriptional regulator